jgi:ABC-type transport system substrate-binding protein
MTTRRALIIVPVIVILFLLQSYFWVPTFVEQTRGNPERLNQFITATIGDASLLNPILTADSASSQVESMVFEGLIDRDDQLRYRGRIARDWRISEVAYFYINPAAPGPVGESAHGQQLAAWLEKKRAAGAAGLQHVTAIDLLPPQVRTDTRQMTIADQNQSVRIRITAPARIRLTLDRVDQELFPQLAALLGKDYFATFNAARHVTTAPALPADQHEALARQLLPATEHNPVIVFQLRPGVRFHDGHELDAEDVKFTYQAIVNPRNLSPRIPDYEPVKDVTVLDPLTVKITYKRLYSPALGTWGMGILPQHLLNADALAAEARAAGKDPAAFTLRQSGFNRRPIGCGPFVFKEWKSDRYIRLDRFEQYWEGPPNYSTYIMRIIPDPLTQEMEFYAGTVDNYAVVPHQVERLQADARFRQFSGTSFGYSYIAYNMRREPFNDPRVRRALGMAIDTDKIIRYVMYGQAESITGPFVKQTDFYNHDIPALPYDPQGALALLAQAGWHRNPDGWLEKDGRRMQFTLITNNGNNLRKAILAIAQDAWKKIGIDVSTDLIEWSVFIQKRVNQLDFDTLILGWSMGIDPDLYQIWHSSQTGPFQLNFVGFADPEADDLILKIRREYDHARQVAYCHRLHDIIAAAQPYTFLYVGRWTALLDKRIVRQVMTAAGETAYRPIVPTKTGSYTYHFNQWIKLPQLPTLTDRG